jgi:hypothetical protein
MFCLAISVSAESVVKLSVYLSASAESQSITFGMVLFFEMQKFGFGPPIDQTTHVCSSANRGKKL